jgi:hypothetical protein
MALTILQRELIHSPQQFCRMWFSCNTEPGSQFNDTSTTDVTICPNQLPYNWNGTDYTAPGTYTFTTTNSAGCDSVATLNWQSMQRPTSTTDVTICPNQLPYNWNGTDYTIAGTYTFTTTNSQDVIQLRRWTWQSMQRPRRQLM